MTAEAGFGRDTWCGDSLVTGRLVGGWRLVAQALFRRLITERGTVQWGAEEAAYGLDIAGFIGSVGPEASVRALPGMIRAEFLKDDRVSDVTVDAAITTSDEGETEIHLEIHVLLADEGTSFDLTVAANDVETSLVLAEAA